MKTTILFLFVLTALLAVQCKKRELSIPCNDTYLSRVVLQAESKQLIDQYANKRLIFKDSSGNESVFLAGTQSINAEVRILLRERCFVSASTLNGGQYFGDYIKGEIRGLRITTDSNFSSFLREIYYTVATVSEGLPPDSIHYDLAQFSLPVKAESTFNIFCQMSKRGIASRNDLTLGNRFISDTTLLGKPFTGVFKGLYKTKLGNVSGALALESAVTKIISGITVATAFPIEHDIYFTAQQGIIGIKIKGGKLWVLNRVE